MKCPKCSHEGVIKNGFVQGKQRWKCRKCLRSFTIFHDRGVDWVLKKQALHLYLEGMSIRKIADLIGISNVAVTKWFENPSEMLSTVRIKSGKKYKEEFDVYTGKELEDVYAIMKKTSVLHQYWTIIKNTSPSFYGNVLISRKKNKREIW